MHRHDRLAPRDMAGKVLAAVVQSAHGKLARPPRDRILQLFRNFNTCFPADENLEIGARFKKMARIIRIFATCSIKLYFVNLIKFQAKCASRPNITVS